MPPNEADYLVSPAATGKQKNAQSARLGAEIVQLDDFRRRDSWQHLGAHVRRVIATLRRARITAAVTLPPERRR